jgi:hypothetical protein
MYVLVVDTCREDFVSLASKLAHVVDGCLSHFPKMAMLVLFNMTTTLVVTKLERSIKSALPATIYRAILLLLKESSPIFVFMILLITVLRGWYSTIGFIK